MVIIFSSQQDYTSTKKDRWNCHGCICLVVSSHRFTGTIQLGPKVQVRVSHIRTSRGPRLTRRKSFHPPCWQSWSLQPSSVLTVQTYACHLPSPAWLKKGAICLKAWFCCSGFCSKSWSWSVFYLDATRSLTAESPLSTTVPSATVTTFVPN